MPIIPYSGYIGKGGHDSSVGSPSVRWVPSRLKQPVHRREAEDAEHTLRSV